MRVTAVLVGCLLAAPLAVGLTLGLGHDPLAAETRPALVERERDYVGSTACRSCHADHHRSWSRTFHSTMTQLPSEQSVLGNFNGEPVSAYGASATPFTSDGRYFFRLPAPGAPREAEVALTVGSRRYQQYFERVEGDDGVTYRRLPLLWHVAEQRFLHLNGVFLEPDSDDWNKHRAVWNANCIFCHNTGISPGLRETSGGSARSKRFDSHAGELGIACESCHGPGRAHAERMSSPVARYHAILTGGAGDMVDPLALPQRENAALCGQCHAQRLPEPHEKIWHYLEQGPDFRPGDRLEAHVRPVTRETPSLDPNDPELFRARFWRDGTARLTAYEYLGVTQSPCFTGGRFTCTSCHTLHGGDVKGQLEPEMKGDRACTQCHEAIGKNVPAHTHHPTASSGSRCLDCHMPRIAYGVLDLHRSHRVESPDVRRDVEAGRPNACTACHADRSADWAAAKMREFWGEKYESPSSRPDGAPLDLPEALASLHAGDPVQRAVYLYQIGRSDSAVAPERRAFLLANGLVGLGDGYGALRLIARRALLALEQSQKLGLGPELRAFDTQAPREARDQALKALFERFEHAAQARAPTLPEGSLVGSDYRLDLSRVRALLSLQSAQAISIGE